jgi:hypothetical protein
VLKKFSLNLQEFRKDCFYPMLTFVSKGSRRFLWLGSLRPLICTDQNGHRTTELLQALSHLVCHLCSVQLSFSSLFLQVGDKDNMYSPQSGLVEAAMAAEQLPLSCLLCPYQHSQRAWWPLIAHTNKSLEQMFHFGGGTLKCIV